MNFSDLWEGTLFLEEHIRVYEHETLICLSTRDCPFLLNWEKRPRYLFLDIISDWCEWRRDHYYNVSPPSLTENTLSRLQDRSFDSLLLDKSSEPTKYVPRIDFEFTRSKHQDPSPELAEDVENYCTISSSKQLPMLALLDELSYQQGQKDG